MYNFQDETTQVLLVVQGSSELSTIREWTFDLNCDACVRLFVCYCFLCFGVMFDDCEILLWYIYNLYIYILSITHLCTTRLLERLIETACATSCGNVRLEKPE